MLITYQENYIQFQIKIIYLHRKKISLLQQRY